MEDSWFESARLTQLAPGERERMSAREKRDGRETEKAEAEAEDNGEHENDGDGLCENEKADADGAESKEERHAAQAVEVPGPSHSDIERREGLLLGFGSRLCIQPARSADGGATPVDVLFVRAPEGVALLRGVGVGYARAPVAWLCNCASRYSGTIAARDAGGTRICLRGTEGERE